MTAPYYNHAINLVWLEERIASLWPRHNTADIAQRIHVREGDIANVLASMRDRGDPRLKTASPWPWTSIGEAANAVVARLAAKRNA